MKKKLIEAIKAKFVGIDDNTAKRLAERAIAKSEAITTDDDVKVAVDAIELSDVLKSVTDFSADEAVKRYEERYNLEKGEKKAGKKEEEKPKSKIEEKPGSEENKGGQENEIIAKIESLFETRFKTVTDELQMLKSGRVSETRKAKLDAILKDLKDYQKKPYSRYQLDKMSDDEFDTLLSEVKEEVNDMIAESKADGASFSPAFGGKHLPNEQEKEATKDEIDAVMDKFSGFKF